MTGYIQFCGNSSEEDGGQVGIGDQWIRIVSILSANQLESNNCYKVLRGHPHLPTICPLCPTDWPLGTL